MRITTKGRYVVRAIINMGLKEDNKPISIKSISASEELSPIFLEQIFTKLKKAGIAESVRGASGGFRIAKSLDQITVLDVLEAVEEGVSLAPCTTEGDAQCGRSADCAISRFWNDTELQIMEILKASTIQDILDKYLIDI